ncbi:MAG TPA: DUF1634 domain-containing protein [Pseudobdellovibrionaceae bacterium]|jgi:uncharacterized membrane protein
MNTQDLPEDLFIKDPLKDPLLNLELRISKLLHWGVSCAEALMLLGWITFFDFSENPLLKFQDYKEESLQKSLQSALQDHHWGLLLAYAGLVLLISLPILRVLMTGIFFAKQRNQILALASFFVFVILLFSFTLGI